MLSTNLLFNDPTVQIKVMPYLVLMECVSLFAALFSFIHATKRGQLYLWTGSMMAGLLTECLLRILPPTADTVWSARSTVMITPTIPCYLIAIYPLALYVPVATIKELHHRLAGPGQIATSALLTGSVILVHDLAAVPFLFQTWHANHPLVSERIMGVPVSRIMFSLLLGFTYALLNLCCKKGQCGQSAIWIIPVFTTGPIAILIFAALTALVRLQSHIPNSWTLFILLDVLVISVLLFSCKASTKLKTVPQLTDRKSSPLLVLTVALYFTFMNLLLILGDPTEQKSFGSHQPFGPCHVRKSDSLSGLVRSRYLCFQNQTSVQHCAGFPKPFLEQYPVCGVPDPDIVFRIMTQFVISVASCLVYFLVHDETFLPQKRDSKKCNPTGH